VATHPIGGHVMRAMRNQKDKKKYWPGRRPHFSEFRYPRKKKQVAYRETMRYTYLPDESERKAISRTLKHFIERSNEAYVSANEHMQKYLEVYEDEYRLCLTAFSEILESMHVYRDQTKILDVKTQAMSMRIMARWFASVGRAGQRGTLGREYGGIFTDARRNRKRGRTFESDVNSQADKLCMSNRTRYMIAGVCLIIAIKYQTDNSELRFLEREHVDYLEFVSAQVLDKINVYNALIFYRRQMRRTVGLPELPLLDDSGMRTFTVRQSRSIIAQRDYAMMIEMCILKDLEWRVSEPTEIDFIEIYAYLAASAVHKATENKIIAQSMFQSVLVVGQCLAILSKLDADWQNNKYHLAPCWIISLAIVICVVEMSVSVVSVRSKVVSALKRKCRCSSKRFMNKEVEKIRGRLVAQYRGAFDAVCANKNARAPSMKRCVVSIR
jgi:hypothetical protein